MVFGSDPLGLEQFLRDANPALAPYLDELRRQMPEVKVTEGSATTPPIVQFKVEFKPGDQLMIQRVTTGPDQTWIDEWNEQMGPGEGFVFTVPPEDECFVDGQFHLRIEEADATLILDPPTFANAVMYGGLVDPTAPYKGTLAAQAASEMAKAINPDAVPVLQPVRKSGEID